MLNYDITKILTNLREAMCQGNCENHEGDIHYVHITGHYVDVKDVYCDNAIKLDQENGFSVEIIDPNPPQSTKRDE